MALAAGDSIYISAALLCDPFETPAQYEVRRIKGNIGKPGMALLIPPQEPRKREEEWKLAGQRPFDGRLENSFHTTSLHLWFTDYTLPIDTGSHGTRDFEIYFLESVVSIHDKGKWVADVDILTNVEKRELLRIPIDHNHLESSACSESNELVINNPMFTSIDDWDEILELPDALGMVRSHKNWLGRLAAAALSSQLGHSPIVLPDEFCWRCFIKGWGSIDGDESDGEALLATLSEGNYVLIC
ncbi:hypothetical protein KJ359_013253 [Pestalotiopsis sp. 9143b]|nr:hypothetical protein KJ359_013253 [Pestalotiopsis sp. 9143b]